MPSPLVPVAWRLSRREERVRLSRSGAFAATGGSFCHGPTLA